MRFGVLGPLVAGDSRGPVDLKGPRHRAVLARLLIARGRVVPAGTLIDDLWDDPPQRAAGALQTFVGALRRALEPDRPPRTPPALLVTEGPGYALRAAPDAVDAWRFEEAVRTGADLDAAMALWRGPAYAEVADRPWARAEIDRLDELWLLARQRRAGSLPPADAVPELEALVKEHPLREEAWRLLALALYRCGRQGDALAALREARRTLAGELGVDPGPALRQLETDVLRQSPALTAPAGSPLTTPPGPLPGPVSTAVPTATPGPVLVGRGTELATLGSAAAAAVAHRRLGLALVSGEPGSGKTALVEAFAARSGLRVLRHHGHAAFLDELGVTAPPPAGDPAVTRLRWHRAAADRLAASAPLLVIVEDLHDAAAETLALIEHLVTTPVAAPVLLVATHRDAGAPTALLARVATAGPARVLLGGLPPDQTRALVRATLGHDVDDATAAVIHERSGGNPFFARELARLAGDGLDGVPPGVRDVVRHRLAQLPGEVREVVRRASVLGLDVELALLPGDRVLDAAEAAAAHGLFAETAPGRFRFAHALVRDTIHDDLSRTRRAAWHGEVAVALARLRPDDADGLAEHWHAAGRPEAAAPARVAAERAGSRFEMHRAARFWRIALDHADRADTRTRVELIMGLARACAIAGDLGEARRQRGAAIDLAAGDPALTTRVITAFDVPASWAGSDDPALARRIADAAVDALRGDPAPADRARLLATIALELRNLGGEPARAAAAEAERIARGLGEPALLAYALNAVLLQTHHRAGLAPRRAAIGAELVELATRHGLVTYAVLGHLALMQAHAAMAAPAAADRHAAAADRLAEAYRIPLVGVFTGGYREMRRTGAATLPADAGMPGVDVRLDRPATADAMLEARLVKQARDALAAGDHEVAERAYATLRPAADELAAGSALIDLGPVAAVLADLAEALGDPAAAALHRDQAGAVALRNG